MINNTHKFITGMVLLAMLFACGNAKKQALINRWYVAQVIFTDDSTQVLQSDTMQGNMLQRQRAVMRDVLSKNLYEFKADGTYITGNAAATSTGKWELVSGAIAFTSNEPDSKKEKLIPYEHLSTDSMVLVINNDQTSFPFKLVLKPVE